MRHRLLPSPVRAFLTRAGGLLPGLACALLLTTGTALANESLYEQQVPDLTTAEGDSEESAIGFGNGSLIVAPIPFSNPMIGSGLVLGAGYLFQLDEGSDPSGIGAAALRSDNGSLGAVAGASFKFADNRWQMSLLGGQADVNYDLIAGTTVIPLRQKGNLARLSLAYGVSKTVSVGFVSRYLDTQITTQTPIFPFLPPELQPALNLGIVNAGIEARWDTRDDTIYPTRGFHLKLSAQRGFVVDGLSNDYNKAYALLDSYWPLGDKTVLALRNAICGATENAPFFDACSVGGIDGFRGFNATQILGVRSLSTQVELRQRLSQRLGLVLFAGTGAAGPGFNGFTYSGSAAGFGLRYRVSKKFPVDFAIDGSYNDEHDSLLYISVGQRF